LHQEKLHSKVIKEDVVLGDFFSYPNGLFSVSDDGIPSLKKIGFCASSLSL
jgi:hypothetical protein